MSKRKNKNNGAKESIDFRARKTQPTFHIVQLLIEIAMKLLLTDLQGSKEWEWWVSCFGVRLEHDSSWKNKWQTIMNDMWLEQVVGLESRRASAENGLYKYD